MPTPPDPYYADDLALVHHRGFGRYADGCAAGILELLVPVAERGGVVLELGCGSGRLTRHLVDAGHRVVATDASPSMVALARREVPDAEEIRLLTLPDDPLPAADAVVSVGHVLNYLADEEAIDRAIIAIARAMTPGGVLAVDVCDLSWGRARHGQPPVAALGDDWAVITRSSRPHPMRDVRDITTFVRRDDGSWRRSDERHVNVLVDPGRIAALLGTYRVEAAVAPGFGSQPLPEGIRAIVAGGPPRGSGGPPASGRQPPDRDRTA